MPSFDVVSEVDNHELKNAIDQASRVVETRFDFKGIEASFELKDKEVVLISEADFQIEQMKDMLETISVTNNNLDYKKTFVYLDKMKRKNTYYYYLNSTP